jgi:hypothetical protein
MNTEFADFEAGHPIAESATRPPARPGRRLALSLLLAGMGLPRRRFAPNTRPSTPASASNCSF